MKYMGSKARHAKELLPIILENRNDGQLYVEPFVGGANMIDKVSGPRMGSDINPYLISLLDSASKGWLPPQIITEDEYLDIKNNYVNRDKTLVGYAAFALSFGAMWFSSYRKDSVGKRCYSSESYRSALKQFPKLSGVDFKCCSYNELVIPENSIIYCDPPYKNTAKYSAVEDFDHDVFYSWCRDKHKEGHKVFVSEYQMPEDFVCLWSKEVNSSLSKNTGSKKGVEKLFTLL